MDKISSVIAALNAGKLPTQHQLNDVIDWFLVYLIPSALPELEMLSQPGKALALDFAQVLAAYKQLAKNKNYDDLVQDTLWHLSEGRLSTAHVEAVEVKEASADMNALRASLRNLLRILWANITGEGSHLLNDFASFVRLALADFAESFESQAAHAKQSFRDTENEVQCGDRDPLGRERKTPEQVREEADPRARFEKTMGTVTEAGSKAVGAGLSAKETVEDKASRIRTRLVEAFNQICDCAQNDQEYKRSLSTLFGIASKWLNRTLDTAASTDKPTLLGAFIHDPTEEKHLHHALTNIRTLCERLARGKSLDQLFAKLHVCALDVKEDKDLRAWFDDVIAYMRNGLELPGYARSNEAQTEHEQLELRWQVILDSNSDIAQKWKTDVEGLRVELRGFQQAFTEDPDVCRTRHAHAKFVQDMEKHVVTGGGLGLQFALEQASWFWQDLFNVYTQRILGVLKNIPIPRIEYVDSDVEFVLENLDISSLNLLPGHAYLRNITDIEIAAPGESRGGTKTAFGTLTHIRLQAIQLSLQDVSFFYKDKKATVAPADFTGIMQFTVPTQGLDVDFKFRLIPNTKQGLAERDECKRFFKIERIDVRLADDITFDLKETNHPIIASIFKPVLAYRFRDAIERTLEEHIRAAFDFLDAIAFDTCKRSEVFADTGLGPAPSFVAAIWSEIGHLRKLEGGVLSGWKVTSTGMVKEGREDEPTLAIGAEPQILTGEKHGPLGYSSEPIAQGPITARIPGVEFPEPFEVAERIREAGAEGVKQVKTFKQSVRRKTIEEQAHVGWRSTAFDLV